jgi:hypothetical protein
MTKYFVNFIHTNIFMGLKYGVKRWTRHVTSIEDSGNACRAEVFPVHAMKPYRGRRGIAPLILKLGTGW